MSAIGFRVKTGRAIAVVLEEGPRVWKCCEILLVDPDHADQWQPYHVVMDLDWPDAERATRKLAASIEKAAACTVKALIDEARCAGLTLQGAGVVGGGGGDPARIGNPHIRAHAAEGLLYRRAVEAGAAACGLACETWSDRDALKRIGERLGLRSDRFAASLQKAGAGSKPWRADEKLAAAAAWAMLHSTP